MKLPKELEEESIESEVLVALERERVPLWSDSPVQIPVLSLTEALRTSIFRAKAIGDVTIGYEAIEKLLANEQHGLQKQDSKQERITRLLIVTNDGSPRFYRELGFLEKRHGSRVLICRMNVGSALMGEILGLKGSGVKAILLNRKRSVVQSLKSLL